jgi:hypothetical protein
MARFDLDRLERLAGGFAVLFYVLLFLAFITAIMGSGGGGLLLLMLGAAAHVGRVGLEDFVERRREIGDVAAPVEGAAGERATGLRLKWLPGELRLPRNLRLRGELRLPRNLRLRGLRPRGAGGVAASSGETAGAALGQVGEILGTARAAVRASLSALVAEIKERPEGEAQRSFDLPHQDVEDASDPIAREGEELDFGGFVDHFREGGDFERAADDSGEPVGNFAGEANFAVTDDLEDRVDDLAADDAFGDVAPEPEPEPEFVPERPRRKRAPAPDAPTAQERYEARQRARRERGEIEPVVAAVEAAETQKPQRVRRRNPGGRPDPLQTRRPTRSF